MPTHRTTSPGRKRVHGPNRVPTFSGPANHPLGSTQPNQQPNQRSDAHELRNSGGVGAGPLAAQRRLGHRPTAGKKRPADPVLLGVPQPPPAPNLKNPPALPPLLKATVSRRR